MDFRLLPAGVMLLALLAAAVIGTTSADAKLKCKNVGKRWQVCGDAKPFKSFAVGVGIRFNEQEPGLKAKSSPGSGHVPALAATSRDRTSSNTR